MLFISHSRLDKPAALSLMNYLLGRGYQKEQLFVDSEPVGGIPPGAHWESKIYKNLAVCRAIIVVCSKNWSASRWCFAELAAAKMRGKMVFPVVITDCDLTPLSEYQTLLARQPEEQTQAFEWLANELAYQGIGPAELGMWPHPSLRRVDGTDPCPYPGLSAFDERYEAVYFGREKERTELLEQLERMRSRGEPRLLLIAGGSGSGKSSLMKAGVLPRLAHRHSLDRWLVFSVLRFGQRSTRGALFETLAHEINARYPSDSSDRGIIVPDVRTLSEEFAQADGALRFLQAAQSLFSALGDGYRTLLLPVDQFEELLAASHATPASSNTVPSFSADMEKTAPKQPGDGELDSPADAFLLFLQQLCSSSDTRVLVIGTVRSDYLDIYENHRYRLRSPLFLSWRLEPFAREQVERIIVEPAERAGIEITPDLVHRLRGDIQESETHTIDSLPLLAFTLESLYLQCVPVKGIISLADYEAIGGVEGAIRQAAERILSNSTESQIVAAIRLCFNKHLVQIDDTGKFVRRVAPWREVIADIPANINDRAMKIFEEFVQARLLTKTTEGAENSPLSNTSNVTLEVTHEALFRCWPPLLQWLSESASVLRWRRDVRRDQESAQLNKLPWKGLKAEQFAFSREWPETRRSELSAEELNWITQAARRANRNRMAVTLIMLLIATLAIFAVMKARQATVEAKVARSQSLAAESFRYRDTNPQLAALLAVEAGKVAPTVESLSAALRLVYERLRPQLIETPKAEAFAVSPSQPLFATGHADGTVQIRSITQGNVKVLRLSSSKISNLIFDSTGQYLAVAYPATDFSNDSGDLVEVWDVASGKQSGQAIHALGDITSLAIGSGGQTVVTVASTLGKPLLRTWSTKTGQLIAGPKNLHSAIVALSPNDKLIGIVSSEDSVPHVRYLNTHDLSLVQTSSPFDVNVAAIKAMIFDRTGNWLITGHEDGQIGFMQAPADATSPQPTPLTDHEPIPSILTGHTGAVTSLAIHPDGKILASGSEDGTIRLWHVEARQPLVSPDEPHEVGGDGFDAFTGAMVSSTSISSPDPHGQPILMSFMPKPSVERWDRRTISIGFSPDGEYLLASTLANSIQRWKVPIGKPTVNYRRGTGRLAATDFGNLFAKPVARSAVVSTMDGVFVSQTDHGEHVDSIQLDRDGATVVMKGMISIQVFNAHDGTPISPALPSGRSFALSPDGTRLSIAGDDDVVRSYETRGGVLKGKIDAGIPGIPQALLYSPDSEHLFVGTESGAIIKVKVPEGQAVSALQQGETPVSTMTVSDSGQWLAVAFENNDVQVWDTKNRSRVGPVMSGETIDGKILTLRFSHDGSKLAMGLDKARVRLINVKSGQQIGSDINTHQAAEALAFTDNDAELRVFTNDHPPQSIILSEQHLRPIIAGIAGRNAKWSEWDRYLAPESYQRTFAEYGIDESFLNEARRRVLDGRTDDALEMFREAEKLQPELHLNAEKTVEQVKLVAHGEAMARAGNIEEAMLNFAQAQTLGWQPDRNTRDFANALAGQALTAEGVRLAKGNEVDKAIKVLEKAQIALGDNLSLKGDYDSHNQRELLEVGPHLYAQQVAFESLMQGAMNQASLGRVKDTAEKLRAAHAYSFGVGLDPDAEAKTMVVNTLTKQAGESIARDDLDRARQLYTQLHQIDPTIDGNREFNRVLAGVKRGQAKNMYLGAIGQPEKAIKLLEQAQNLDPEPSEKFAAEKAGVMAIAHKDKGDQLAEGGKIELAIEEYEAARTLDPSMNLVPVEEAKARRMDFLRSNASRLLSAGDRAGALVSLLSLRQLDSTVSLDHELIVLTLPSGDARPDLRTYLKLQKEKVFLLTPLHSWQWVSGMKTPEAAMAKAKEDALVRYGGAEAYVYMQNDTVVVPNEELTILRQLLERSSNSADAQPTGASDLPDSTEATQRLHTPIRGKMEPEVD